MLKSGIREHDVTLKFHRSGGVPFGSVGEDISDGEDVRDGLSYDDVCGTRGGGEDYSLRGLNIIQGFRISLPVQPIVVVAKVFVKYCVCTGACTGSCTSNANALFER